MSLTNALAIPRGLSSAASLPTAATTTESAASSASVISGAAVSTSDSFGGITSSSSDPVPVSTTRPELALAPSEARVVASTSAEPVLRSSSSSATNSPEASEVENAESPWTWKNILPKVLIAVGTITLVIALFNTATAAPALIKANGLLGGLAKTGAAFVGNLGRAFLYVVVTPFVAAYEAVRFTAIVLKDVIAAGAKLLWQGVSTVASFTWNNILVPTAQFLKPAVVFVWENVVVKAAVLLKDVVVWSFQNVIRPVAEFIAPAVKFIWDNVVVKGFEALFWTIGKAFEGTFKVLGFLYENALVPVSQFIRSVAGAVGRALAPAANWVFSNVLAPVGGALAKAAVASYQYVIAPVASALGSAISTVATGIASAWRAVAGTIGAVFGG